MVVCVVSAFYRMPSKLPISEYLKYMEPFFRASTFPLVLFTEPELVPVFAEWRKEQMDKTILIALPPEEFVARKYNWLLQNIKDKEETHSPELYAIWYEKKEFVLRAIALKAFGATSFVWCDAGILRIPQWLPHIKAFPLEERIEPGKMTLLQIVDFAEGETAETNFRDENRIGGGIQAADAATWIWWAEQYDVMVQKYLASDKFIGKDQSIMAACCLTFPDRVKKVKPHLELHPYAQWFWLLLWLSGFD